MRIIDRELFLKIQQLLNLLFYFKHGNAQCQGFMFAEGPFSKTAWGHITHHVTSRSKKMYF